MRVPADAVRAHVLLVVATGELLLREVYHRTSGETLKLIVASMIWLAVVVLFVACRSSNSGIAHVIRRTALLLCVAFCSVTLFDGLLESWRHLALLAEWAVLVVLAVAACVLVAAKQDLWDRAASATAIGAVLFFASQMLFVSWKAPDLKWPSAVVDDTPDGRSVTVFLLLDEMNADLGRPLVETLRTEGLKAVQKDVRPVGRNTADVVPQMFSGEEFVSPKPCGLHAICGRSAALDFARITASRNDIDVVGFFHPYCAIRGLRTCVDGRIPPALWDVQRLKCALENRTGGWLKWPDVDCRAVYFRVWGALKFGLISALWTLPVWSKGGLLFAHLPIPHPPGEDPKGDLAAHYRANAEEARSLVREMVHKARAGGLSIRLVVFSDHPLRLDYWCRHYWPYVGSGCAHDVKLKSDLVPLIVAGAQTPDLAAWTSNANIFSLVRAWH